jgi:multidrug efflux pump subunit AcrB
VDAASSEITGAVIGSTLTTVLVFVPLAFIVGVYGQFFAALSWSLCIAVLVSMVISLTIVPVFAAKFLAGRPMPEPGRIYNFLAHLYEIALAQALRFPRLTVIASIVFSVAVALFLWQGIPIENKNAPHAPDQAPPPLVPPLKTGLMPAMDEGAFVVDYWAPAGTPLAETVGKADKIEEVLFKNPDVAAYLRRTGSENGLFVTQTNRGDITVVLRSAEQDPVSLITKRVRPEMDKLEKEIPKGDTKDPKTREAISKWKDGIQKRYRRRPVRDVMAEVEDAVKDAFGEHQLKIDPVQIMQDELDDMSGANKPVEIKIFGKDHEQLRKIAVDVGEMLEKKGKPIGVGEVLTNVREGNPDLMVRLDGYYADKLGMKPESVSRQLRAIFQGQIATQAPESALRITDVRVRYPDSIRFGTTPGEPGKGFFDPQFALNQLILLPDTKLPAAANANAPLQGPQRAVPLHALGTITPVRTPDEQWRENQQPAVFVSAELKPDASLGRVVGDVRGWMAKDIQMPPGYHWEIGGHYIRQQETFRSLWAVMIVAILLVFLVLAIQFKSVVLPLLIFLTQPLSLLCGFLALYVTNTPLNVSSAMGVILLIGLDMKNGILLVEYIQQLRQEGMALRPALLLAGRTRFRPILMTSLAAILGLFPLALGIGPGAQMQQPLAIMVIGGLTANMLFTRMVIPVGWSATCCWRAATRRARSPRRNLCRRSCRNR